VTDPIFFYSPHIHTKVIRKVEEGFIITLEILPMYFDTSLKTTRRECSAISSPRPLSRSAVFFLKIDFDRKDFGEEEMSDGNREDTTVSAQIEEIECAISLAKSKTVVERNKSHQFKSPVCTPRNSHAYRS
jgi:hypothetical protein